MNTSSKSIQRAFAAALVIATLTGAGYVAFVKGPSDLAGNVTNGTLNAASKGYELARRMAQDIDSAIHFRPKVTYGENAVVEASSSIAELSTVEKPLNMLTGMKAPGLGARSESR